MASLTCGIIPASSANNHPLFSFICLFAFFPNWYYLPSIYLSHSSCPLYPGCAYAPQFWAWDTSTKQIKNGRAAAMCLSASSTTGSGATNVWGRPLQGGDVAVVFLNAVPPPSPLPPHEWIDTMRMAYQSCAHQHFSVSHIITSSPLQKQYTHARARRQHAHTRTFVPCPQGSAPATVTCDATCFAALGLKVGAKLTAKDLWAGTSVPATATTFAVTVPGSGASVMYRFSVA